MKITRMDANLFRVETGTLTADLRPVSAVCRLDGNVLRTVYEKGRIMLNLPVKVILGPESLPEVESLKIDEQIEFQMSKRS